LLSKKIPHSTGCIRVCVDTKSGLDALKKEKNIFVLPGIETLPFGRLA
jgi:hypothetical protein